MFTWSKHFELSEESWRRACAKSRGQSLLCSTASHWWECFNFFGWHQMSDWLEANFLSFILYFWKVTKYFLKKSAPYVENWVISRIKFADDKKVGVLEYHTLAFCASLRRNDDKDNDRNNDNDSVWGRTWYQCKLQNISKTSKKLDMLTWKVLPSLCPIIWLYQYINSYNQ